MNIAAFAMRRPVTILVAVIALALMSGVAVQRLVLGIVELYEDLVLAKAARDIAQQLVQSSGEFDRIASVRYQGGVGLGSDAARATANLADDEIASIETTHRPSLARYTTEPNIAQARLLAASGAIEKESIEAIATTPAP